MSKKQHVTDDITALRENLSTDGSHGKNLQWLLFALVLLCIGVAGAWLSRPTPSSGSVLIYSAGIAHSDIADEQAWAATAAHQSLFAYLDAGDDVQVLDGTEKTLNPARKAGADWILTGSLSTDPGVTDGVILALDFQSGDSSGEKYNSEIKGLSTALNDLTGRASQQVYMWLERGQLSGEELGEANAELLADKQTQQAFAEGKLALVRYDARKAVHFFTEAINRGGKHPIINVALSAAWAQLGYREEAKQWAQRAYEARAGLSRERQLQIEGQFRIIFDEWDRAIDIYKALKEFHPNDPSYALTIAETQLKKGDHDAALKTIMEMRAYSEADEDDPRIDIVHAQYWHQKGNYAKSAALSDVAIAKAQKASETAILAQAYLGAIQSESEHKRRYLDEAQQLFDAIDSPRFKSAVLSELAQQERYDNRLDASVSLFREALALSEGVGDEAQTFIAQHGLAIALDLKNELNASYELKNKTLAYHAARGAKAREAIVYENIGISLFKMGRLNEAEESFTKANAMFEVVEDSIGIAWAPYHLSRIRSRQGNLDEAETLAARSVLNSENNPEGQLELNATLEVAQVQFYQGRYDEAHTHFVALQAAFSESKNLISAGESALMLARIALRKSDFDQAQDYTGQAAKIYEDGGVVYYVLDALIVRNDLAYLTFRDDIEGACAALRPLAANSEYALIGMRARLRAIRCDVLEAGLTVEQAKARIVAIETEAKTAGLFEVLLDAGQVRAQILEHIAAHNQANIERARVNALAAANGWATI